VINYPQYNLPHNFEHDTSIIPSLIYNIHGSNLKNEESMILSKKSPKNIYILLQSLMEKEDTFGTLENKTQSIEDKNS
jgi:hypothetical protein